MLLDLLFAKTSIKKSAVIFTLSFSGLFVSSMSFAEDSPQQPTSTICALPGVPPSDYKYKVVKKLKLGKGSYGSVTDIQPLFLKKARDAGADAVINYNGSQRFGFFPWRVVRPVITGKAIQWDKNNAKPFSCIENGGVFL